MKKRFLIPLVVVGAPIAIGFADTSIRMASCNFGDQGACTVLEQRRSDNAAMDAKFAEMRKARELKAERKQAFEDWKTANPDKVIRELSASKMDACTNELRAQLKDPDSLRVIKTSDLGHISYTATNSFGGRVQGVHACAS